MNLVWKGHNGIDLEQCCPGETPCLVHSRSPVGYIRSPHRSQWNAVVRCPECEPETPAESPLETATS